MRIGSLFSGYGGLDLAVQEALGEATVAWHSENDPSASAILAHHWPDIPNLGDITSVDWAQAEPIDAITAGFPCNDVSAAGRRAGLRPGTRSGLWQHAAHAIHRLRPALVFIENVGGLLYAPAHSDVEPCPWCLGEGSGRAVRALGAVLGDLAVLGYDARVCGLRAADIGAPHGRFRVFVAAADARGEAVGLRPGLCPRRQSRIGRGRPDHDHPPDSAADSGESRLPNRLPERRQGPQPRGRGPSQRRGAGPGAAVDWGAYLPAITRWERVLGRAAPSPTEPGAKGGPRLSPRFVEWLMGLPEGWVTEVPGITRNAQLRALGNGVVPQQAAAAISQLLDFAEAAS